MDIKIDIMANGENIIYNLVDDGKIEEPCIVHLQSVEDGKMFPTFVPILMLTDKGTCEMHPSALVMYTVRPNSELNNMFVEMLKKCRARRTGIVSPTKAQIINIAK